MSLASFSLCLFICAITSTRGNNSVDEYVDLIVQAKIYKYIKNMTFVEQKEFMHKVISGELKLN